MTIIQELKLVQKILHLSDVDMCNFMCITMQRFRKIMRGKIKPNTFNLIMFIASTRRSLYSLTPEINYNEYQRALHFLLLAGKKS